MIKLTRYQWTVFFAAWLGWGFDIFDGLLFNFVAPNAIPTLLGLPIGGPEAKAALPVLDGILNSLLLLGWAAGGVIFGPISDRFGRKRVLMITMLLYALGTAACAFVTEMWQLIIFRIIASLGIGGEWAAGSAMVAEVVPEEKRVEAGALLYTSAPFGLFLATFVNARSPATGSPTTRRCPGATCCCSACCPPPSRSSVRAVRQGAGALDRGRRPPRRRRACAKSSRPSMRARTRQRAHRRRRSR